MVSGIILASGFSERMKQEKLLLLIEGVPVIERVVRAASNSLLDELIVIYQNEKVGNAVRSYNVRRIFNPNASEGQSASVILGVCSVADKTEAYMFLVGDQPYLNSETIDGLITLWWKDKDRIVVPLYNGERGNPVIFPSRFKNSLMALTGDVGGRQVIQHHPDSLRTVNISDALAGIDVDTPEMYQHLTNPRYDNKVNF